MTYARLGIREFGEYLLATNDLDPVYVALVENKSRWSIPHMARWLLAYWCFYDCGVASYLSEGEEHYWQNMVRAAKNEEPSPLGGRWPRGRERRHFRGKAAISSIDDLLTKYGGRRHAALHMIEHITSAAPDYKLVTKRVQEHRGFGPWIAFKVADMIDRVIGLHIDFSEAAVFMFKDPVKGAEMVWRASFPMMAKKGVQPEFKPAIIGGVVDHLITIFSSFRAPPLYDRPVGLQEVETVLCKWKSHMNGHYPLGNDIREIRHGVTPWAEISKSAAQFLEKMPDV